MTLEAAALFVVGIYWIHRATDRKASSLLLIIILAALGVQLVTRYFAPGAQLQVKVIRKEASSRSVISGLLSDAVAASEKYSEYQLRLLTDLLLHPSWFRTRVVEEIRLDRGITKNSVLTALSFDDYAQPTSDRSILVPVLTPIKGRLYDRQVIEDGTGVPYSAIPQGQSAGLCAGLVLHVFKLAYDLPGDPAVWDKRHRQKFEKILDSIARSRSAKIPAKAVQRLTDPFVELFFDLQKGDAAERFEHRKQLQRLVGLLSKRYAIIAEMPYFTNLAVYYKNKSVTSMLAGRPPARSALRLTRVVQQAFRIPSGYVEVEVAQAKNCQSYHLKLQVPPGSYIGLAQLVSGKALLNINRRPQFTTTTPYLRRIAPTGSYVHVYGRGLKDLPTGSSFQIRVYERPYGTELYGAISCLALLAVAIILRQTYLTDHSIDVGAAAVGLPVALATIGTLYAKAVHRSLTASTIGVLGGLTSCVTASAFFLVFMIAEAGPDHTVNRSGAFAQFWSWSVGASGAVAVVAVCALLIRLLRYLRPKV